MKTVKLNANAMKVLKQKLAAKKRQQAAKSKRTRGKRGQLPELPFLPEMGKVDVTEGYVFSTGSVAVGAKGELRLFTTPRGQLMPSLGPSTGPLCSKCQQDAGLVLTEQHTNVLQSGQLGAIHGDAAFKAMRVIAPDLATDGKLEVRIGGRVVVSSPLSVLLNKQEAHQLSMPALCARTDTLEVLVKFDNELTSTQVPKGKALIRVELIGVFARPAPGPDLSLSSMRTMGKLLGAP